MDACITITGEIMSFDGPKIDPRPFVLSEQVSDNELYKIITRLPTKETLEKLEALPPFLAKMIKECFVEIYSHVTQRVPNEGSDYYFVHVAASVEYEVEED